MTRFETVDRVRPCQRSRLPFLLFIFFLAQSSLVEGQQTHQGSGEEVARRFIMAVATTEEMSIDGELNESSWVTAGVSQDLRQRDPEVGQLATEPTEIRCLYNKKELYIAVISYDSEPDKILATERQRDSALRNDDTVALVLDTFHDLRNGYLFKTNALGTKYDAHITDEGRDINRGWDENWRVAGKITKDGWITEFAIPFKSIRTSGKESQTWGLEVERIIRRKNEFTYWNGYRRGYKLENVSQAGLLYGLKDLESGYKLRTKPYVVAGLSHHSDRLTSDTDNASDGGMEVMKYRITSGLTADVTLNSNFIETEVDSQRVNLDRWELFYPERREFFLEGGGIFKFGVARGEMPAPDVALFHSRRIGVQTTVSDVGVSSRNVEVPVDAGLRVTGKLAGFGLGLLNVQTGELPSEGVTQSNYGVVRIKRDILKRSSIGTFLLNREISGSADYNRVYGMDANFVFARHFSANALFAKSSEPGVEGDNWVSSGGAKWNSDFLFAGIEYLFLEPDFRDDLGFVPRTNQRRISPVIDIRPRPNSRLIRQLQFGYRLDYISDQDWVVQTRYNHYNFHIFFQSGDHLMIAPHRRMERVNEPFLLRPGITVSPDVYTWNNVRISYTVNPARRLSGNFVYQPMWNFFGGDLHTLSFSPRIKVSTALTLNIGYRVNFGTFPEGDFTDHVVNSRIEYAFNNQLLTRTVLQYNSAGSFKGVQFVLDYIFRPGDDFFLLYTESRGQDGRKDRKLAMKLTRSFDF